MKHPLSNIILIMILLLVLPTASAVGGNLRAPWQGILQSRGEVPPEQMAREAESPSEALMGTAQKFSGAELRILEELRQAKVSGDAEAVLAAETALAELRGKSLRFIDEAQAHGNCPLRVVFADETDSDRWLPHEYCLASTELDDLDPVLASDSAGNLYAAFGSSDMRIHLYRSSDGGEHWQELLSIGGGSVQSPSIAVAEGNQNQLFIAFHYITSQAIYVFRMNLDDQGDNDFTNILEYAPGVSHPRIVVDSDEYSGWYAYLVFNSYAVDNWVLVHSRTLDYGATWTEYDIIGGYCGYPDEFYDASEAKPDLDFGSGRLYVAFDNYPSPCSSTTRDVFAMTSTDFGSSFGAAVQLTTSSDDEHDPAVAAVKNYGTVPTVLMAWTRYWNELDNDVWYRYSQDGGTNWAGSGCISCTTDEERNVNLASSVSDGLIHAAFWDEANVDYAVAPFDTLNSWARHDSLSTSNTHADVWTRPGIMVDPTRDLDLEAGIAWMDTRNSGTQGIDIYYDAAALPDPPDDFFLYTTFNPGLGAVCGIDGFVDEAGLVEGIPGAEYIVFTGGAVYGGDITGYIYRVQTDGDPNTHPDNPWNTGPIAPRNFTYVGEHYMGYFGSAHDNAFYVDETGLYYGPSDNAYGDAPGWASFMGCAIYHWNFDWTPVGCEVPVAAPGGNQTLARNPHTGQWWAGGAGRAMRRWDGTSWVTIFTAPDLGGSHHDGLELINNSLYVSDMTSDVIAQYRLDDYGDPIDPPWIPAKTFFYTAALSVEGMGYGPNGHIWITGGSALYEIGGGALQVALEGIPDQCIEPGESFDAFDLDDYTTGQPPFTWEWSGNADLTIIMDADNVVTVTYPTGWTGQETVTFTVIDALGRPASDQAVFTVATAPLIGDIPDQTAPFEPFGLDDYLLAGDPAMITWTASGMSCFEVHIDPATHVATVTVPLGCSEIEEITFTAVVLPCAGTLQDSDSAVFDPGATPVDEPAATGFRLAPPVPNPSEGSTQLSYSIPSTAEGGSVSLVVYDLSGRRVKTLVQEDAPSHEATVGWDGRDDAGAPMSNGVYFVQLRWNGKVQSRRVVLLRRH